MEEYFHISFQDWQKFLGYCTEEYRIYAPLIYESSIDYAPINREDVPHIIYNTPKPVSPLKIFYLPIKENVACNGKKIKRNIIIGAPSCDLKALDILDEIYLNEPFVDSYYKTRRENTILIGTDCHSIQNHCHCNTYGLDPIPEKNQDMTLTVIDEDVYISLNSDKGIVLFQEITKLESADRLTEEQLKTIQLKREAVKQLLIQLNQQIPSYSDTTSIINKSDETIWQKYSSTCVSCGGCATACPTCTCFLLLDRPGFEKIRQMDACQYPGFSRIAAGEDPLKERFTRFRNRYLCKYVWKPEKFESLTCTGCGRCIEACIGKINKNELFVELTNQVTV